MYLFCQNLLKSQILQCIPTLIRNCIKDVISVSLVYAVEDEKGLGSLGNSNLEFLQQSGSHGFPVCHMKLPKTVHITRDKIYPGGL
jgi:hypothetical protein